MTKSEHEPIQKQRLSKVALLMRPHSGSGRLLVAASVGVSVGTAWGLLMCVLAAGSTNEASRHMICFPLGLGITAVVVLYLRRLPELVGLAAGFFTMFVAALIVGPQDFWMGLWIIVYGVSGCICGPIVGHFLRWMPGLELKQATNGTQATLCRIGSIVRVVLLISLLSVFAIQVFSLCLSIGSSRLHGKQLAEERIRATEAGSRLGAGRCYVTASTPKGTINRIEFNCRGLNLDDDKMKNLEGLTAIVGLDLSETRITDAGLAYLKGLKTLEYLQLAQTDVDDKGIEQLVDLENLEILDLTGTRVTQDCAKYLERLPKLRAVFAFGTTLSRVQGVKVDSTRPTKTWMKERPE